MNMFDTVSASERGIAVHLTNPITRQKAYLPKEDGSDDKSKPCRIMALGPDSPTYKKRAAERLARRMKNEFLGERTIKDMSEAEIFALINRGQEDMAEDAADACTGWENLPLPEEILTFSRENAIEVFTRYPVILEEFDEKRKNRSGFFDKT